MTTDNVASDQPRTTPDQRRPYPAPTIELEATEVASEPPHEAAEQPTSSIAPDASHFTEEAVDPAHKSSGGGGEPPPRAGMFDASKLPFDPPWQLLGAGAVGGALVALILLGLWFAGALSRGEEGASAFAGRLARLEQQLGNVSARQAAGDAGAALAARLDAAEAALKSIASDESQLNRRMDDVADSVRGARERSDAAARALAQIAQNSANGQRTDASQSDIEDLTNRVDALEGATKALQAQLAKTLSSASGAANDRAIRLAVVATALRLAVERGQPFATELAQAKHLMGDPNQLAPLEPYADRGVPTTQELWRELGALTPALLNAADVPHEDSSFLGRLEANAEHLVRIRPLDETSGDDPASVILRIEFKSRHGDVPGVLTEFAKLPPAVRAPADGWIERAKSRESAIELAQRISADSLAALAASAG